MASRRPEIVLVTGASSGIGAAVARRLAAEGFGVVLTSRRAEACASLAAELDAPAGAWSVALDVADPASIAAAVGSLPALLPGGRLPDGLVNNAGFVETAPWKRTDDALYERLLQTNFHGARRVGEALLPAMVEGGFGRIVNMASSAGLRGYPYTLAYGVSKFALVGWTLGLAAELGGEGIATSAVCPHYVDTPMLDGAVENLRRKTNTSPEEGRKFFGKQNPGGRLVTTDEVADAVLACMTEERNGQLLELDGSGSLRVRRPNETDTAHAPL